MLSVRLMRVELRSVAAAEQSKVMRRLERSQLARLSTAFASIRSSIVGLTEFTPE